MFALAKKPHHNLDELPEDQLLPNLAATDNPQKGDKHLQDMQVHLTKTTIGSEYSARPAHSQGPLSPILHNVTLHPAIWYWYHLLCEKASFAFAMSVITLSPAFTALFILDSNAPCSTKLSSNVDSKKSKSILKIIQPTIFSYGTRQFSL